MDEYCAFPDGEAAALTSVPLPSPPPPPPTTRPTTEKPRYGICDHQHMKQVFEDLHESISLDLPRPAMATPQTSANQMARWVLCAGADLAAGFTGIGPEGGFRCDEVPYFFQLQCIKCGTVTEKDVCLYPSPPERSYCTDLFGSRRVRNKCYPTCDNDAHLIRKCKGDYCHLLGSVELLPANGKYITEETRSVIAYLRCMGYVPVKYAPATTGWVARTTAGEKIQVVKKGDAFWRLDSADELERVAEVDFLVHPEQEFLVGTED